MACSCRAADQLRDTLHENERKWVEEEDEERDGDARARPKERLRWEARNDATPPPAASTSRAVA
jgi:hypothetical protein